VPLVLFELQIKRDDKGALTAIVKEFDSAGAASKRASSEHSSFSGVLKALESEASNAAHSMVGMAGSFGSVVAAAGPAGLAVGVLAGAVVGLVGGAAELVSRFAGIAGSLTDMANKTGISTTALQEFRNTSGVSIDSVSNAIGKMQANLGSGSEAFTRLGLNIRELTAMRPDDAFRAVAAAIAGIGNETLRSAAAQDVFGKGAMEVLPLIREGMEAARDRARELGGVLDKETVAAGVRLGAALADVSFAFANVLTQMGAALGKSPELVKALEDIASALGGISRWVQENGKEITDWMDALVTSGKFWAQLGTGRWSGAGKTFLDVGLSSDAEMLRQIAGPVKAPVKAFVGPPKPDTYRTEAEIKAAEERAKKIAGLAAQEKQIYAEKLKYRKDTEDAAIKAASDAQKAQQKIAEQHFKDIVDTEKSIKDFLERAYKEEEDIQKQKDADFLEEDRLAREEMDKQRQKAEKLAAAFGLVGRAVEDLGTIFLAMGASADSAIMQVTAGLSKGLGYAQQITQAKTGGEKAILAGEAAIDIWNSNATNRSGTKAALSGAATGAMVGASIGAMFAGVGAIPGAIIGAVAGGLIGYFSGAGWRKVTKEAARVLGQDVSDELMKAIQKTQGDLGVGLSGASLLNLSKAMQESKRGASEFTPQMLNLMEMVSSGALPAAAGIDALGDAFSRFAAEVTKSGRLASQGFVDVMRSARAMGQDIPGLKEWTKKWLDQAAAAMAGITGLLEKEGVKVTLVGGLDITTKAQAAASATIFSAVFWAQVKEQGLLIAADSMGASFDALRKRIEDQFGPELANQLLGGMGRIFDIIANNPAARAALQGIDAVSKALEGLANAGYLTQDAFAAFETTIAAGVDQEVAAGLTRKEALESAAPALAKIIEAHQKYGMVIDEATQKLIDEARANGIAFPTDPVYAMVDAIHELINAIRIANGLPPLSWGKDSVAGMPDRPGGPGGRAPSTPEGTPRGDHTGFALGGISRGPRSGHWELLHGTEMITPLRMDEGGNGGPGGGVGGGVGGGWTLPPGGIAVPPGPWGGGNGTVTPEAVASAVTAAIAAVPRTVEVRSSTPITIQETPLGREGRQEMRDESLRSIKDALWAHDQDLEDLIRRAAGTGG